MCCSRRTCKHYKEIFCDGVSIYKISVLERYLIGEFVDTFFSFPSADNIQTADVNGATCSSTEIVLYGVSNVKPIKGLYDATFLYCMHRTGNVDVNASNDVWNVDCDARMIHLTGWANLGKRIIGREFYTSIYQ